MAAGTVGTIIQARLGSERLPSKVLADIHGLSMLERCYQRAAGIGYRTVAAIPADDYLELIRVCSASASNWYAHSGPSEDVLDRYYHCAQHYEFAHIVRVTADCPLLDIEAAQITVREHLTGGHDFTHYIAEGRAVQVFTMAALRESWAQSRTVRWNLIREHPDQWILRNPNDFQIHEMKFSVDTPAELERLRGWLG